MDGDDLRCDNCPATFESRDNDRATELGARARGWHTFQGKSVTGRDLEVSLCERCIKGDTSRRPKLQVLDGQEAMF